MIAAYFRRTKLLAHTHAWEAAADRVDAHDPPMPYSAREFRRVAARMRFEADTLRFRVVPDTLLKGRLV